MFELYGRFVISQMFYIFFQFFHRGMKDQIKFWRRFFVDMELVGSSSV